VAGAGERCRRINEVDGKLREFLVITDEEFHGVALWTGLTHSFELFDLAAYLVPKGSEKRCGKTRVHDVVAPMSGSSLVATHMKPETLFRAHAHYHFTAFLDEAHLYIKKSDDHEAVLNGGFQKGKQAWRCVGNNHDPQPFDTLRPSA
jgi:hypothetical protein